MSEDHAHHPSYVKIWLILLALLGVSIVGPFLGHPLLTLVTAFGIAFVKAYMVARHFMHINVEKRYIVYMMSTCLVFMVLFFAGTAPDVMKQEGSGWVKPEVDVPVAAGSHGGSHGDSHGTGSH